jgi:hypothetical protein
MKRRESQGRGWGARDDQRFARAALDELRGVWPKQRKPKTRRTKAASRLVRLAAETREMLALWTYYRLACLDAMDAGHMGLA